MKKTDLIFVVAHLATPTAMLLAEAEKPLPDEIQWMPPGTHKIEPDINGERREITITVDELLGNRFAEQFALLKSQAAKGETDYPFLDFNHEGGAASAEVLDLFWGGNDPKTGGIRAKVKWTKPGEDALRGRAYRRFSPAWFLAKKTFAPIGIGANLGGLVNLAAFQSGAPVVASGSPLNHQNQNKMTEEQASQLAQLPTLIASLATLNTQVTALAGLGTRLDQLEAKAGAVDTIANRVATLEGANQGTLTANAEAAVARAVASGRLAPQDTTSHAFWKGLIQKDANAVKELEKFPVNPAFLALATAGGSGDKKLTATEECLAAKGV